jgi:hypothetical protein
MLNNLHTRNNKILTNEIKNEDEDYIYIILNT